MKLPQSSRQDVALIEGRSCTGVDKEQRAGIVLASESGSLSAARSFVASMLELWGCEDLDEIVPLLTSEIVSNAVRHAEGSVKLDVSLRNGAELRVQARDESPDALVVRRSNPGGVGGHGLTIVESLARCWGVERHKEFKVVWFETLVSPRSR